MPLGPMHTKKQKAEGMHQVMHEFKEGGLHSGSKKGPKVKSRAQAVAIGLSQTGQSKYDRSGHQPGNPGFSREGKAPYAKYDAGKQAKQPHGHSLGYGAPEDAHKPNQSYFAEQREHWGSEAKGKTMKSTKEVAYTGPADRGSELIEKCGMGHENQPSGKSIQAGTTDIAEHHKGHGMGGVAHSFKPPAANKAHGYGHAIEQRSGPLRLSGHSGAHRVGKR